MTNVSDAAAKWHSAGVSTIPIIQGGSKKPLVRWAEYQTRIPELGELDRWFGNGKEYGLAVICGSISGNLEMVELEAEANNGATLDRLDEAMREAGIEDLWAELTVGQYAYLESSPSGGLHILYRVNDHAVPGNTKIAWREATAVELAVNPLERFKVLVETRGEGGYVIVAPTTGLCHPTGKPWELATGTYGEVPYITWDQREALMRVFCETLDESPQTPAPLPDAVATSPGQLAPRSGAGLSPGDEFEASTDWAQILEPHGWQLESQHGFTRNWTRPGKERRDGASATTGRASDRDRLYVFSTSTEFRSETPYTKFGAYALLNHGGDHSAAARTLARLGFGERVTPDMDAFIATSTVATATTDVAVVEQSTTTAPEPTFTLTERGNAERLWHQVKGRYHWVGDAKAYYAWDGKVWGEDSSGAINREHRAMLDRMTATARVTKDEDLAKWTTGSCSERRETAALKMMRSTEGVARSQRDFDAHSDLVNVRNGMLNLRTGALSPHDPSLMMTRMLDAEYTPGVGAPMFQAFLEKVLPDPELRAYVQRCVAYSLYGQPNERAIFMAYGPKSTGKSTFMEIIGQVLGSYAATAPAGTFKQARHDKGPSADLHMLRGKRFVATSESSDSAQFDEDLIKRITGGDTLTSRALYQDHQTWRPECSVWLATNFPPRFNSDDDAIWDRAKLIPFTTQIDVTDRVPGLSRLIVEGEAAGVLNWVMEGMTAYLAHGLGEPSQVTQAAVAHRDSTDPVIRFLDERAATGVVVVEDGAIVSLSNLYPAFKAWSEESGVRALSQMRFRDRLASSGRGLRVAGVMVSGVRINSRAGFLGTMIPDIE